MLIVHILLKYIDSMTMHWIIINNQDIFYSSCFFTCRYLLGCMSINDILVKSEEHWVLEDVFFCFQSFFWKLINYKNQMLIHTCSNIHPVSSFSTSHPHHLPRFMKQYIVIHSLSMQSKKWESLTLIIKALTIHTQCLTCQFADHQEFPIFCSHVSQHMQRKIIRMQWNAYSLQKIYQGDEPSTLILFVGVTKE